MSTFNFTNTITVLHRKKVNNLDVWEKKEYASTSWYADRSKAISGSTTSVGYSLIARVLQQSGFVAEFGDYVIKGSIDETEITSNNVLQIVNKYRPDAFQVKLLRNNTQNPLPHYRLEGV